MNTSYNWRRYWRPSEIKSISDNDGFLIDPTEHRKFVNGELVTLDDLEQEHCLILIGEPGMGKTTEIKKAIDLMRTRYRRENCHFVDAKLPREIFQLQLTAAFKSILTQTANSPQYLFIDSFDEAIDNIEYITNHLISLLESNQDNSRLYIRLVCRTAVWSSSSESKFENIWSGKVKKYELCFLTRSDVAEALLAQGQDPDKFLANVSDKQVGPLAAKPITLAMLIGIFKNAAALPSRIDELYERGCKELVFENDPDRRDGPKRDKLVDKEMALNIASCIAFITILGGRSTILKNHDDTAGSSEINLREITKTVFDMDKYIEISSVKSEDMVRQVIESGLFSSRGKDRIGWAHKTYEEFLASRYIVSHEIILNRLKQALFISDLDGDPKVVMQLQNLVVWIASKNTDLFSMVAETNPLVLLRCNSEVLDHPQRSQLTDQLFEQLSDGRAVYRWDVFYQTLKVLKHPELGEKLQKYLDKRNNDEVRTVIINTILDCELKSLNDPLLAIAIDKEEKLAIRSHALSAIEQLGTEETKNKLTALTDPELWQTTATDVKLATLQALWPDHITGEEFFSLLPDVDKDDSIYSFKTYIDAKLISNLDLKGMWAGLDWVESHLLSEEGKNYTLVDIACSVFIHSWKYVHNPLILKKIARIAYKRLLNHENIYGGHSHSRDERSDSFLKDYEARDEPRRALVTMVIQYASEDLPTRKDVNERSLAFFLQNYIYKKDISWMIESLCGEKNMTSQIVWSKLIQDHLDFCNSADFQSVCELREKNQYFKGVTQYWFDPIPLASDDAKHLKEEYDDNEERNRYHRLGENEKILEKISVKNITALLEQAEGGNLDAYFHLQFALCANDHEQFEYDLQKVSGWKVIGAEIKERVIKVGKNFIIKPLGGKLERHSSISFWPMLSMYRVFYFLYINDTVFLDGLSIESWSYWAPLPLYLYGRTHDIPDRNLVALAYQKAPNIMLKTIESMCQLTKNNSSLGFVQTLDICVDEKINNILLHRLSQIDLTSNAAVNLIDFLSKHAPTKLMAYLSVQISLPLSTDPKESQKTLEMAKELYSSFGVNGWRCVWRLMQVDEDFGRQLIELICSSPMPVVAFLHDLTVDELGEYYKWLEKNIPTDLRKPSGKRWIAPPPGSVHELKNLIVSLLSSKGTLESHQKLVSLFEGAPERRAQYTYLLDQSKKTALEKSWEPMTIKELVTMVNLTREDASGAMVPHMKRDDHIHRYGKLKLDLNNETIQYDDATPVPVQTANKEIQFFIMLLRKIDSVVEYVDVGKELNLSAYIPRTSTNTDKGLKDRVNEIKKELTQLLRAAGMPSATIKSLLVCSHNQGYRLRPPQ